MQASVPSFSSTTGTTRALVLAVQPQLRSDAQHHASCQELEALAKTLGFEVVEVRSQKRTSASRDTYVGAGSLKDLADFLNGPGPDASVTKTWSRSDEAPVDLVLVNDTLSPKLQRRLERALDVEVIDRSGVILEIFERRARTRQARLEVEIARLRYELPRLRDDTTKRGRQGGGGRGEQGDTIVSLGKQRIRMRITTLEAELSGLQTAGHVRKRRRQDVFQVALVGYTNAGKSSLMRGLTGNEVLVEDQLFATLDTTVRQLSPVPSPPVVVADTVGFIQDLPHELVASFRSTLDEAGDADLLLLVLDASDSVWTSHLEVTSETLAELDIDPSRIQLVFNKCDRLDDDERAALLEGHPDAVLTSAHDRDALASLRQMILDVQERGLCEELVGLPHEHGALRAEVHAKARVLSEKHDAWGSVLHVLARPEHLERWHDLLAVDLSGATEVLESSWNHGFELDAAGDLSESGLLEAKDAEGQGWVLEVLPTLERREEYRRRDRARRWLAPSLPVAVPVTHTLTSGLRAKQPIGGHVYQGDADAVLERLADVLAALWSVDASHAAYVGVESLTIEEARRTRLEELETASIALEIPDEWLARWRGWLGSKTGWPAASVVLHGAWASEQVRVDAQGAFVALDGWGDVRVGDPGDDLAEIVGWLGDADALLAALEERGAPVWEGALEHIETLRTFSCVSRAAKLLQTRSQPAKDAAQAVIDAHTGA